MKTLIRAVLILGGTGLASIPMTGVAAADDCVPLGGAISGGECQISVLTTAKTGTFNLDETLHILNGGTLRVGPAGITINITGDLRMDAGSKIDGNVAAAGHGADIVINATGSIKLAGAPPGGTPTGAIIRANHTVGSCLTGNRGGNITLNADSNHDLVGDVTLDPGTNTSNGSQVTSIAPCGRGEIIINGVNVSIDGDVLSDGTSSLGRGGPISVNASCNLTITDLGSLISRGRDFGADLVHLQGGCEVKIFGLIASTAPGHLFGTPNKCNNATRPDKPANSVACVEIWAGTSLLIDARAPHNAEINADTAHSGGNEGFAWIDLFARGPISIFGDVGGPCTNLGFATLTPCFAVHANQFVSGAHGGAITVKSKEAGVTIANLGLQANALTGGGSGGPITIQAKQSVDVSGARNEAKGATIGFGPHGGKFDIRSFGEPPNTGSIFASSTSVLDVTGGVPADGVVNLTACGAIQFPPGTVVPASITPTKATMCGGAPAFANYVILPLCTCQATGCPCVNSFSFIAGSPPRVEINGTQLTAVNQVRLSTASCEPAAGTAVPILTQSDPQITVDVSGLHGDFKIITISGNGSCCSAATVNIP